MSSNMLRISVVHISKIWLTLSVVAFLTGCATSMVNLQTDIQEPDAGNAIVVGSFLIEPVPEWQDPADDYWLSIWKGPVPRKEYTISLQTNKEEDVRIQLPAGIYEIVAIYEGEQGFWSRGQGRVGGLGLWFRIEEGEILYIGRLRLSISPEPAYIRRERDEAVDLITTAILGPGISGASLVPSRPIMYTAATIEDNLQGAVELLRSEGWNESAIGGVRKSLITTTKPE